MAPPLTPIAKGMAKVGWIGQLAANQRAKTSEEIKYVAKLFAKSLWQTWKEFPEARQGPYLKPDLMRAFFTGCKDQTMEKLSFSPEQWLETQIKILNILYGDPFIMQQNGYKPHAIPYWNPTAHKVNIHPMGIVKSVDEKTREARFYDFVEPGDFVMIPHGYTVGGKSSTVYGVAPQLRPMPRQLDSVLDVTPFTYLEWCTFTDPGVSECCRKPTAWHDNSACPVCTKCGKPCMGNRF